MRSVPKYRGLAIRALALNDPSCSPLPSRRKLQSVPDAAIGIIVTYAAEATPGRPVYLIHTSDRAVLIGEEDLTGPLRDLVITILATGDPA